MTTPNKPNFAIMHDLEHTKDNVHPALHRHLTIMRPFHLGDEGLDTQQMIATVTRASRKIGKILLEPGGLEYFGPNNDIPVTMVIDPTGQLLELHTQLATELARHGAVIPNPYGFAYNPHVAHVAGIGAPDEPFICDSLTITSWLPETNSGSIVVGRVPL